MKSFLGVLCVALAIQLGAVVSAEQPEIPERFKAAQGLEFHQDAGDKAATRSITSSEPTLNYDVPNYDVYMKMVEEANRKAAEAAESKNQEWVAQNKLGEGYGEVKLATRGLDTDEETEEETDADSEQDLDARSLLETGMSMMPTAEGLRRVASDLSQKAAGIPSTVSNFYNNPQAATKESLQAAQESLTAALNAAKAKILSPEMRQTVNQMYNTGLDKGINAYKDLNQRLSPGMAKTLNHGIGSAMRGVQAAKESPLAKSISRKVSSYIP